MRNLTTLSFFIISTFLTACGGSSGSGTTTSSAATTSSNTSIATSSSPVSSSLASSSSVISSSSIVSSSSISSSMTTISSAASSSSFTTSSATVSSSSVVANGSSVATISSSTPAISSSLASSSSVSSTAPSSASSSIANSSSSVNSSASAQVIIADMSSGWRGNGTGNSGVNFNNAGVSFSPSADGQGAVFDVLKPTQLENAVVEMVVNVSNELKSSGANLQIFAQIKSGSYPGEWDCWSSNSGLTVGVDITLSCTIDEADDKFNQTAADFQVGIQAKGTAPSGTVTIKSAKITLAQTNSSSSSSSSSNASVYSANVDHLKDLAIFPIGIAVSNNDSPTYNILTSTPEKTVAEKHFNQMTAGNIMKVSYLHPDLNTFSFTNADAFVDYAKSKNIKVHAHTLIWHSDYQVPNFIKNWTGTAGEFLAMLDTHVTTIVDHFEAKNNIASWDVVNEAINDNTPATFRTDSAFYIKSGNSAVYIERAFKAARLADANVELYYNDYNIEQNTAKTTKLIEMLTDFQTRNIPITGVGFQMHVYLDYPSISNLSLAMKKVVDLGYKVKITELDVAINNPYSGSWPGSKVSTFTTTVALAQKKRYCDIVAAYKNIVPEAQRGGITVWGSTDANTWLNDLFKGVNQYNGEKIAWPLLFDNQYNDKPALRGFADGLLGTTCTNL